MHKAMLVTPHHIFCNLLGGLGISIGTAVTLAANPLTHMPIRATIADIMRNTPVVGLPAVLEIKVFVRDL
jgi:hypothetical protein